jgi:hypothetical protein
MLLDKRTAQKIIDVLKFNLDKSNYILSSTLFIPTTNEFKPLLQAYIHSYTFQKVALNFVDSELGFTALDL